MTLCLWLPNWVGDAVQATPAIRALRQRFPERRLVGVGRPAVRAVLTGLPWFDALLDKPDGVAPRERPRAAAALFEVEGATSALLFTNDLPSAFGAFLARVPERVGYVRRGRGPFLNRRLVAPRSGRFPRRRWVPIPALDYYLGIAEALGCAVDDRRLELAVEPAGAAQAATLLGALPTGRRLAVLNNSGAFGPAKLWTEAGWVALARRLHDEADCNLLLLAGPAEAAPAQALAARIARPGLVTSAAAEPSLALSKALVAAADLLVSTDSGPRHFGPAFGVPTVSLFGPTDPRWTDLGTPLDRMVHLSLDCQPCQQRTCPLGHHRCMEELDAERVYAASLAQLRRGKAG